MLETREPNEAGYYASFPYRGGPYDETRFRMVRGGWDHEHCALCWVTISVNPEDQHEGYTDGKDWICVACFQQYVAPRL